MQKEKKIYKRDSSSWLSAEQEATNHNHKPQYVSKHLAIHPLPDRQEISTRSLTHTHMQQSAHKHQKMHFFFPFLVLSREKMHKAPASLEALLYNVYS